MAQVAKTRVVLAGTVILSVGALFGHAANACSGGCSTPSTPTEQNTSVYSPQETNVSTYSPSEADANSNSKSEADANSNSNSESNLDNYSPSEANSSSNAQGGNATANGGKSYSSSDAQGGKGGTGEADANNGGNTVTGSNAATAAGGNGAGNTTQVGGNTNNTSIKDYSIIGVPGLPATILPGIENGAGYSGYGGVACPMDTHAHIHASVSVGVSILAAGGAISAGGGGTEDSTPDPLCGQIAQLQAQTALGVAVVTGQSTVLANAVNSKEMTCPMLLAIVDTEAAKGVQDVGLAYLLKQCEPTVVTYHAAPVRHKKTNPCKGIVAAPVQGS